MHRCNSAQLKNDSVALRRLASDQQVRYESRAKAAGTTNATGLGSGELDLLASNTPISAAAAEKPYFYHARVKAAAQTNDSASRIRLLRGAVVIDPVPNSSSREFVSGALPGESIRTGCLGSSEIRFHRKRCIAMSVARDLATALPKVGPIWISARRLPVDVVENWTRRRMSKRRSPALDADLQQIQENQRRMPRVHDNLDQTDRVRPRV